MESIYRTMDRDWDIEEIHAKIYTETIYVYIIKLLPVKLRHLFFSTMIYIIAGYLQNLNIDIMEYHYENDGSTGIHIADSKERKI